MHYLRHALASILPLVVAVFLMPSRYFGVYDLLPLWGGVHVFLDGGDPYDFGILKQLLSSVLPGLPDTQHFVSPPWTLAVLTPLLARSFEASRVLVLVFTISAFCVAIIRLQRMWGKLPPPCTIFLWGYVPLWTCLYFGQISAFLLLGTVLALEWLNDSKGSWWKWALAVTLLGLKPQGFMLAFPFLLAEFLRRSSWRERWYGVAYAVVGVALISPSLPLIPSWLKATAFSYSMDTATLSRYVRACAASFGAHSPLTLWILPLVTFIVLARRGLRIPSPFFFLCVILLSQLTAPYIWVYDSVALLPLFYAALGVVFHDGVASPRRQIGLILTILSVLPAYMALGSDFSSMVCHNIILAGACVVVAPELRRYVSAKPLA